MGKILGRDAILAADDRPVAEVDVPEWDGTVLIRPMDALMWSRLVAVLREEKDDTRIRAQSCAACMVDEAGELLFEPGNEDDLQQLMSKNHDAILRVSNAIIKMSRGTRKDVEAFRENFPSTEGEGSPSD